MLITLDVDRLSFAVDSIEVMRKQVFYEFYFSDIHLRYRVNVIITSPLQKVIEHQLDFGVVELSCPTES